MSGKQKLRNRIIKRLGKMRDELRQTITDKRSWNENRTDAPPFDLGFDIGLLQCIEKQLAAWERNDLAEVNRWNAKMQAMSREEGSGGKSV